MRMMGRSEEMAGWCSESEPMSRASGMPASTSRSQLWTEKGHGSSMKSIRVFRWWGRDFQNFRASFSFRQPLKSSRQRQAGTMEASMVSRSRAAARLGLALIFPALNPLDSMMRMVAGLTQEGSVAWLAADAQRQRASLPERVQFLLQRGVPQLRPRLDAAVPAFIRFNEGSFPAYFRGSGVQRTAGR